MLTVRVRLLLLLCPLLPATACSAQQPGENPLLTLMPELRGMAAPDWLQEGTRVTYHAVSATLPGFRFYLYREGGEDAWRPAEEVGPAGAGLLQYTCVYRSASGAVGTLDNYVVDINTGSLTHQSLGGSVDPAGAGACWVNPAALTDADRFQAPHTRVVKMPHPIGERVYDAIRFHYTTDSTVDSLVYELETGLLLFHRHTSISTDQRYTLMTQMTFAGLRQSPPTVADAPAPEWAATPSKIHYQGSFSVAAPGTPLMPIPVSAVIEKVDGGTRWGKFRVTRHVAVPGQVADAIDVFCGAGGIAGEPWMAPALLSDLTAGQVLDRDPELGVVTTVEQITPGPEGTEIVVISREGKGFKRSTAYDRATGMMLMVNALQHVGTAVHQTQFELVR